MTDSKQCVGCDRVDRPIVGTFMGAPLCVACKAGADALADVLCERVVREQICPMLIKQATEALS